MTMISEYTTSDEPLRVYERFSIYPGYHRRNKHVACRCKPTSVEERYAEGLVAEIDELDEHPGHFRISIGNSTELFYVMGEDNSEIFALEACGVIFGIHPNMIVDVMSQPVRISRQVYEVADSYGASNVIPLGGPLDDDAEEQDSESNDGLEGEQRSEEDLQNSTVEPSSDVSSGGKKSRRKASAKKPEGGKPRSEADDVAIKRSDLEGAVEIDVMPSINSE